MLFYQCLFCVIKDVYWFMFFDENNVVGIFSIQRKEILLKFVGKGIYINYKKNYVNFICDEVFF